MKLLIMTRLLPESYELRNFSVNLTSRYSSCDYVCSYIGRKAFDNLIYMFQLLCCDFDELEVKIVTACNSIVTIREYVPLIK